MRVDCIIGIDTGMAGGLSIWRPNHPLKANKMPKELMDLKDYFQHIKETCESPIIFLEKVQLRHDDLSGGKAFNIQKMLKNYERLKTIIEYSGIPFVQVHPMSWQSYLNIRKKGEEKSERKNRYKETAQSWYPEIKATLWNCDATLIVHFGRKKLMNDEGWVYENLPKSMHDLLD